MKTNLAGFIKNTPEGREADSILRACVHCGFCTATCPTYQLLGDELDGPRGRIYLIKELLEGCTVTAKTQLHLDRCLTCRACETTCPSGVQYGRLVDIGRNIVEKRVGRPFAELLKRAALRAVIPNPALFGLLFLGDAVTPMMAAAIVIATAGVIVMSTKAGPLGDASGGGRWPMVLGLSAGACFALSAIGFRGAILSLQDPSYAMATTFTVAAGLMVQSILLTLYPALRDRAVLAAIFAAWRPSVFAGFMGALASQFWFLAFALATAASVRTLALVEVLFAQAISHFVFRQPVSAREGLGITVIVIVVVLLIWAN